MLFVVVHFLCSGFISIHIWDFNTNTTSAAYMRQWIGSASVQIMACRVFATKPLFAPILVHCQSDPKEQILMKFKSKNRTFHLRKCIWRYRPRNGGYFWQRGVGVGVGTPGFFLLCPEYKSILSDLGCTLWFYPYRIWRYVETSNTLILCFIQSVSPVYHSWYHLCSLWHSNHCHCLFEQSLEWR